MQPGRQKAGMRRPGHSVAELELPEGPLQEAPEEFPLGDGGWDEQTSRQALSTAMRVGAAWFSQMEPDQMDSFKRRHGIGRERAEKRVTLLRRSGERREDRRGERNGQRPEPLNGGCWSFLDYEPISAGAESEGEGIGQERTGLFETEVLEETLEMGRDELIVAQLPLRRERLEQVALEMGRAAMLPALSRVDPLEAILFGGDCRDGGFPLGERTVKPLRVAVEKLSAPNHGVSEQEELFVKRNRETLFPNCKRDRVVGCGLEACHGTRVQERNLRRPAVHDLGDGTYQLLAVKGMAADRGDRRSRDVQ